MSRGLKIGIFATLGTVFIAAFISFVVFVLPLLEENSSFFKPHHKTTIYNGETYEYKRVINVLIIGVDKAGEIESSGYYLNEEQADFLCLLSINTKTKKFSLLHINRDTMCDVNVLSIRGTDAGTSFEQIALSHNYGDGTEISAKNTVKTVKNFLNGIDIDYYILLKMDAVSIATDKIGGVEVTLNADQDLSNKNPLWVPNATITLDGDNVMDFIRSRMSVEDGTNIKRMVRQRQFIEAFIKKVADNKNSYEDDALLEMYNEISPYTLTDVGVKTVGILSDYLKGFEYEGINTIEGTTTVNETTGYVEFYVNEEALDKKILEMFYDKSN